jgi:hypothetical protein
MKKLLIALGLILVSTPAIAGNYPPVPYVTAPIEAGTAPFNNLVTSVNTNSTGLLYGLYAPVTATAAATTQTLATYTLPASYLTNVGQGIRIKAVYTKAANANSVTPVIVFGTYTYTGGANTTSAGSESVECLVYKTGASTQTITCNGVNQATAIAATAASGTSPDTATIAINGQCTQGSASADCVLSSLTIESLR